LYFERFYDEIIRYDYIRKFIFDLDNYLNIINESYNLKSDEFILPQSLLMNKYFDDLTPLKENLNKVYDTAYPQIHVPYNDIHKLIDIKEYDEVIDEDSESSNIEITKVRKTVKRCPNGFRRNKETNKCEPENVDDWNIVIDEETQEEKYVLKSNPEKSFILSGL
jgi:hypothetical protein